jgi:hypothetical protein
MSAYHHLALLSRLRRDDRAGPEHPDDAIEDLLTALDAV